jgi:hypothetical protein
MRPAVKRRVCWAVGIGILLIAIAIGLLVFADATAITEEGKKCAPSIWQSQWPRYLGCAMGAHEALAGGLIGAAGALFAAWLAFQAIQEQMQAEAERLNEQRRTEVEQRQVEQAEAKESAVVCIAPLIHAAAEGLLYIEQAVGFRGEVPQPIEKLVSLAATHVAAEIDRFVIQESLRGLGLEDRLVYLTIIGTLNVFVNISDHPPPNLGRLARLEAQRQALMNLHTYLAAFDMELAAVFARDSKTSPPAGTPRAS